MSIQGWLVNRKAKSMVKKLNSDAGSTALGAVLGAVQLANIDYFKLFHGDQTEVGKLVAALATGLVGWLYKRGQKSPEPPPSA